jgi:hypothetical protein
MIIRSSRMGHDLRPAIAFGGISIFSRIPDANQPLQVRSARELSFTPIEAIWRPSSLISSGSQPVCQTAGSRCSGNLDRTPRRPRIPSETILPN